jgi:hypothetical protein
MDLLTTPEWVPILEDGDFVVAPNVRVVPLDRQAQLVSIAMQRSVIAHTPGNYYWQPLLGFGVINAVGAKEPQRLETLAREALEGDGWQILRTPTFVRSATGQFDLAWEVRLPANLGAIGTPVTAATSTLTGTPVAINVSGLVQNIGDLRLLLQALEARLLLVETDVVDLQNQINNINSEIDTIDLTLIDLQNQIDNIDSGEVLRYVYPAAIFPPRKTIQPWIGNASGQITLTATNFILININRDVVIDGVIFRIIDNPNLNLTYGLYNTQFNNNNTIIPKDALFLQTLINPVPGVYRTTFAPVTVPKGTYYFAHTGGMTFHTSGRLDPIMYSELSLLPLTGFTNGANPLLTSYPNTLSPTGFAFTSSGQISFRFFEV